MIAWSTTKEFQRRYGAVPQGLAEFREILVPQLGNTIDGRREQIGQEIRIHADEASRNIAKYQQHFQLWGYECPLVKQHQRTLQKGLPRTSPLVDLLLLLEMRFGALMGIHDVERITGDLSYDCARIGESFPGMRCQLLCKEGEFVIRDHEGVVASYFQGADNRTCVSKNTRSVVLFAFGAPSVPASLLEESLAAARDLLKPVCSPTGLEVRANVV